MDDDLWAQIEPLLPPGPEKSPGLRPVVDRLCLRGFVYVLQNDMAWQLLPLELEFGSGRTCWRRLERWQQDEVSDHLHRILLAGLNAAGELDRSRVRGRLPHPRGEGGAGTGPLPVDQRQMGSKHQLICDARGTPFKVVTTAAGAAQAAADPARHLPQRPPNIRAWANPATSWREPLPHSTHDRGTRTYRSFRACASQEPLHSPPLGAHADAVGSRHRSFRSSGEMHAGI
ncbi:transposase [Streptomyces sp. NPDC058420]|uniref:transposase n=1 Tax=Streptomyces sp. NPDC058420 TaxID=3346489 RepID=UPI00364A9336